MPPIPTFKSHSRQGLENSMFSRTDPKCCGVCRSFTQTHVWMLCCGTTAHREQQLSVQIIKQYQRFIRSHIGAITPTYSWSWGHIQSNYICALIICQFVLSLCKTELIWWCYSSNSSKLLQKYLTKYTSTFNSFAIKVWKLQVISISCSFFFF